MSFGRRELPARKPLAWPGKQNFAPTARICAPVNQVKVEKLKDGKDAQAWKDQLGRLGCMCCIRLYGAHEPGPVELHHIRTGGWGRGDYTTLIPLCVEHHRGDTGVHGLGTKGFAAHYGFDQQDLLSDTLAAMGEAA